MDYTEDLPLLELNPRLKEKLESPAHPDGFDGRVAGLDGHALNGMDAGARCYEAGWHDVFTLTHSLATFFSESLLYTRAFHHNVDASGTITSTDWGPCQLNDKAHPEFFPHGDENAIACNPDKCFAAAFKVWQDGGQSFGPWYGWKNGVALDDYYLRRASLAILNLVAADMKTDALARAPEIAGRPTPPTKTRTPMISTHELRTVYPPGT